MDFKDVYDYVSNNLSIEDNARMPWHDVSYVFSSFVWVNVVVGFFTGPYDIMRQCSVGYLSTLC